MKRFTRREAFSIGEILLIVVLSGAVTGSAIGQETESATKEAKTAESPPASIDDVAWITGQWAGEAMGGQFEESWSEPSHGTMMGMFKFVSNGQIGFYEFLTIAPVGDSLILRLKHFAGDLKGWEEKDESVEFPLLGISDNEVRFDGLRFEKISEDEMHIIVKIDDGSGKAEDTPFVCKRVVDAPAASSAATTIKSVLAIDAVLSGQRNRLPETGSLADAIQTYLLGLDGIEFGDCPSDFSDAFQKHRHAWQESIGFLEQHNELRGEMHELFDQIREAGGEPAEQLQTHYQKIMDTWNDIESIVGKHGIH